MQHKQPPSQEMGESKKLHLGCHDHSAHWRKLSRRPGCLNNTLSNRVVVQQGGLAALGNINAIHVPAQQEGRDAAQSLQVYMQWWHAESAWKPSHKAGHDRHWRLSCNN